MIAALNIFNRDAGCRRLARSKRNRIRFFLCGDRRFGGLVCKEFIHKHNCIPQVHKNAGGQVRFFNTSSPEYWVRRGEVVEKLLRVCEEPDAA